MKNERSEDLIDPPADEALVAGGCCWVAAFFCRKVDKIIDLIR
jgi:hypothetical protein